MKALKALLMKTNDKIDKHEIIQTLVEIYETDSQVILETLYRIEYIGFMCREEGWLWVEDYKAEVGNEDFLGHQFFNIASAMFLDVGSTRLVEYLGNLVMAEADMREKAVSYLYMLGFLLILQSKEMNQEAFWCFSSMFSTKYCESIMNDMLAFRKNYYEERE